MENVQKKSGWKLDALIAGALGVVAAIIYSLTKASFAYPGESAHLMAVWNGLDVVKSTPYPLMAFFAGLFGNGNAIAVVSGVVAVVGLYLVGASFVKARTVDPGDGAPSFGPVMGRAAGLTAAVVFLMTPAVIAGASHIEPRMFEFAWVIACGLVLVGWRAMLAHGLRGAVALPIVAGVMWGLGGVDSVMFALLVPFVILALVMIPRQFSRSWVAPLVLFVVAGIVAFVWFSLAGTSGFLDTIKTLVDEGKDLFVKNWFLVALFATVPFIVALAASGRCFNETSGWLQWIFHITLSVAAILAVATPLSPSSQMEPNGVFPIVASAFAACVAGYLAAYWVLQALENPVHKDASNGNKVVQDSRGRVVAYVVGGALAIVFVFKGVFNLFMYETERGSFADKLADKILQDLGDREWLVTDGTIDDNLRLRANATGKKVTLVALDRDLDTLYRDELAEKVRAANLGGEHNTDLTLSLSLGILPFVQDWFEYDTNATKCAAVFGAPDLWYAANIKPVPEFVFFGADAARKVDWYGQKDAFLSILHAPIGWGSFDIVDETNPTDKRRVELRRHLGFVANNRGVWLQDNGRDDEAFDMYEMVLHDIDKDNVCALFNLFEMARSKHPKALAKKFELERRLKSIVDDPTKRFKLWTLSSYYGYIRNPEIFIRLGFTWARSGRPGNALSQMRRAVDFIPSDRRSSLMNMIAALYASEDNRVKSREIYTQILEKNKDDHDALIGMMRLSMLDGDTKSALAFLERATGAASDDPRVQTELAMLAFMKNNYAEARKILGRVTDAKPDDLRAWSLMAAVTMQMCDASKDPKERKELERDLEGRILPKMEKEAITPYDYYVQTTRAFLYLRKGEAKRRDARDALIVAANARPDVPATQDLVLGLDISLDDAESAERHAKETLKINRKSPLANYVMGALALRKGEYETAETYLRKAADAARPVTLAMNDLAEVYRRLNRLEEAERYARRAVKTDPQLYVTWETLGSIILDRKGDLDEAQKYIEKACELSKKDGHEEDIRMVISLARVQIARGDKKIARVTLRKVQPQLGKLTEFERKAYDELVKNAK